jgi:HD-like signal output (HDOD) protein
MKRILFVDDEPLVLSGLQRTLRPRRRDWEMAFAESGAAALALLGAKPFDVIVTDMRMPEMDGATLLMHVRDRFPAMIRIVLSGYFDMDAAVRAVPVAHQFLVKPCEPAALQQAIERSSSSRSALREETVRRVAGAVGELPSLPRSCAELVQALEKPDASLTEIATVVGQDVGMTAKVLQLVNSAFFGLRQEIADVRVAVSRLGMDVLKQLVLSVEVFRSFQPPKDLDGFSLAAFERHSLDVANITWRLPLAKSVTSKGTLAAFLHDVGKLVLATRLPGPFAEALGKARADQRPLHLVEEEIIGASHAETGAYLLSLWGLPSAIVAPICLHHRPSGDEVAGEGLGMVAAVHIANALAHEQAPELGAADPVNGRLDLEYLAALGVTGEVAAWRRMAKEVLRR